MGGKIVIAGGTGFIGSALTNEFFTRGYSVVVLSRSPRPRKDGVLEVFWDGKSIGSWTQHINSATALINLAGQNVHCRHTPENLQSISESRINSTNVLGAAIAGASLPPRIWIQASGIGFYGDNGDTPCEERNPMGKSHSLAEVCKLWESSFNLITKDDLRKVILRIGVVLGRDGGGFPVFMRLTRRFLGGTLGSGQQFVSWIHIADLARIFVMAVENENLSGVYNAVAPNPVKNADFMGELRHALRRPWCPSAPEFVVEIGAYLMQTEPLFVLSSCRAIPKKLLDREFHFKFPKIASAFQDLSKST